MSKHLMGEAGSAKNNMSYKMKEIQMAKKSGMTKKAVKKSKKAKK